MRSRRVDIAPGQARRAVPNPTHLGMRLLSHAGRLRTFLRRRVRRDQRQLGFVPTAAAAKGEAEQDRQQQEQRSQSSGHGILGMSGD